MPPVSRSIEKKFFDGLKALFNRVMERFSSGKTDGVPKEITEFINSEETDGFLRRLVSRMSRNVRTASARSWREAAAKGGYGKEIHEAIKKEMDGPVGEKVWAMIAENVAYIKTVPQEWANYISNYAAREALKGKRPEEVEAELRKIMPPHMTKNLKCIARTECAKANAAIVQARAEAVGANCYFWRCVRDERVRDSHALMDRVLVFYDDPPSPEELNGEKYVYGKYHAGNIFNCRCYQEVVVDVRFLPDVFKYYAAGKIQTTTKAAFLRKYKNAV